MLIDSDKEYFREIVERTRELLRTSVEVVPNLAFVEDSTTFDALHFSGKCGLAQCIIGYHLAEESNYLAKPLATQSLNGWWHGHAALVIESQTSLLLIDPTFAQFSASAECDQSAPSDYLNRSPEGQELLNQLLQDGVVEVTPEIASLYLAAFCCGEAPFESKDECLAFFRHPPAHPLHFAYDENDDRYSPEALQRDELHLEAP